ncbi:MAG: porin, partial [Candidatus Fibromonas sp.]|nr:porin [Candidatus Fibromonas sp.]
MSNTHFETLAIHAGSDKPVHRIPSKLAKLSVAALFAGASALYAQEVPVLNAGGTKISLYGFLQANAVYENGRNDGVFWTEKVPSRAQDGEGNFAFNVNQTRIGFNLSGPQTEGGGTEVSGKFESDFANNNNRNNNGVGSFRIRQSYGAVKFKDLGLTLLIGQTADLIGSLTAPTLNQAALKHSGSIGTRRPQIRLTEALGPAEIAVAATDDRASGA